MGEQRRCAISARIIGVMQRDESTVKMFMISMLWSDQSEGIIYRSFHDFKKLNKQLKKRFVVENPFRKQNRVIPKFRDRIIKTSFQKKSGPGKAMRRMRSLESYCTQLLNCDSSVTQSSEVIQFFIPKDHDLQPDFAKNSTMILPSEDLTGAGGLGEGHSQSQRLSMGNVTHPFVTRMYRCVAPYETKDTMNRAFPVALGERLDVQIKDPAGWWLVENEDKQLAWFPAPYLELCDEEEEEDEEDGIPLGDMLFCAVRTYSTKQHDEISVPIGSVVEVLRQSDDGWWLSRYNGRVGYVPSMYLQPYQNPRAGLHSFQRKLHSSSLNLATQSVTGKSGNLNPPNLHESSLKKPSPAQRTKWLQKARSLDDLSDTRPGSAPVEREELGSESRKSSLDASSTGSEFSFSSGSSSGSESSTPPFPPTGAEPLTHPDSPSSSPPLPGRSSDGQGSTDISLPGLSLSSSPSKMSCPRVPPRPQAHEILTRCTTMTRKAALASKARLLPQPGLVLTY
ncbi:NADPH oxidase organizer 1b [Osmerus eperlanus]|uniref:NADPH oxidase organizer 1b n=1 Tax=Osmerus eperlanus TaxID=29151 RepID=UPI002E0F2B8E